MSKVNSAQLSKVINFNPNKYIIDEKRFPKEAFSILSKYKIIPTSQTFLFDMKPIKKSYITKIAITALMFNLQIYK